MQKYVFVQLLEKPPKEGVFHRKDWPLHVTIAPLFAVDMAEDALVNFVRKSVDGRPPASAEAADDEMFGPNHDLRVTLIDMSPELKGLHKKIYTELLGHGALFDHPQYCGDNYRAHATVQKSGRLHHGDPVLIEELTLVDMFYEQDINQRRVIDTIKLKS